MKTYRVMLNTKTKSNEKSMKMGLLYIPGFWGFFYQEIDLCTAGPLVLVFLLCPVRHILRKKH